jgi:hypothetical protein
MAQARAAIPIVADQAVGLRVKCGRRVLNKTVENAR